MAQPAALLPPQFLAADLVVGLLRNLEDSHPPPPNLPLLAAMPRRDDIASVIATGAAPTPACFAISNGAPSAQGWDWDSAKLSLHGDELLKSEYLYASIPDARLAAGCGAGRCCRAANLRACYEQPGSAAQIVIVSTHSDIYI